MTDTSGRGPCLHRIRTPDSRIITCVDAGAADGYPVVFAHGMPGTGLEALFFHEQALAHGFRVLCMDRPGIRLSTYQPDRTLLDYPNDVATVMDHLNLGDFVHMGWSSGGSRTLACAYSLRERVTAAVVLSGYTHFPELPHARTLLLKTRWPGPLLASLSPRLFRLVVAVVTWLSRKQPDTYMATARRLFNDADNRILEETTQMTRFRHDQLSCLDSGATAIATDLWTEMGHWGFKLRDVNVPTLLWQGEEDQLLPIEYCQHMAREIPDAELTLLPRSGHFYPLDRVFQADLFDRIQRTLGYASTWRRPMNT